MDYAINALQKVAILYKISGNGIFQANGGNTSWPNTFGGGGGRIAIHYKTSDFSGTTNALSGTYCLYGCAPSGEAGTVKMIDESILPPPLILSSVKTITAFNFSNLTPNITGVIDETNYAISLTVPFGTDVKVLVPTIAISKKASINPNAIVAQDFTSPITYTVTAEDASTQNYVVTVTTAPDPTPIPDITVPTITSYMLNSVASSFTNNPSINPTSLSFNASKNVDWVSVKIEKEDDASIYKYFYPGVSCDGKDTCTEIWNGLLAGGTSAPSGTYKIKARIRDLVTKAEYDYFSPYIITVNIPI